MREWDDEEKAAGCSKESFTEPKEEGLAEG